MSFFVFKNEVARSIYFFLVKKWYFDLIYNNLFVFNLLSAFYTVTFKVIDRGLIEMFGPLSTVRLVNKISSVLSLIQTGFIYNYIFIILLSVIFILSVLFSYSFIFNSVNFGLLCAILITIIFLSLSKK
jgi:NADH:ubiquinone oxidoreductase subunit 5 (subunit L)/multisubunit Na+/H+ antiporter MnhA subunit